MRRVPAADLPEHDDADQRAEREPGDAGLAERHDDEGGEQRPDRLAEIAADLEDRLRQAEAAAGGEPRDARGFRMEDRRAEADQHAPSTSIDVAVRIGEQDQPDQRRRHADRQRIGQRPLVGVHADDRLQQRRRHLEGHGEQADLPEVEVEVVLQHRIERGQQRLHHVVDEVAEADGEDDRRRRFPRRSRGVSCMLVSVNACSGRMLGSIRVDGAIRLTDRQVDDAVLLSFGARTGRSGAPYEAAIRTRQHALILLSAATIRGGGRRGGSWL